MSEEKNEPITRIYTIPLDTAMITPRHRRAKRAVADIKKFAIKHMKSEEIKIETDLNERIWNRGIRHPPRRITVKMDRDEDGVITISLPSETEIETTKAETEKKKTETKAKTEKKPKSKAKAKEEAKVEAEPEAKTEEAKAEEEAAPVEKAAEEEKKTK